MANLKALRQKVKNITDYSPELAQFNDQLDELLNDAYYCIWTMKRWNFSTELSTMRLHTDITTSTDTENSSGANITATVTKGERQVVLSHNIDRLHDMDVWEGQPMEIDNMEYTINKLVDMKTILLDRPFEGTSTATNKGWKIKKRWYDLPENCLELLYLGHRDYPYVSVSGSQNPYGKSTAILPRREEDLDLRVDYTQSYAEAYITSPTLHIEPAEQLTISEVGSPTGEFQSNKYYEFAWAFIKDGKVGALSEPTWNKNFDQNTGERKGLPCWLYVVNGTSTTSGTRNDPDYLRPIVVTDINSFVNIVKLNQLDNGSPRYIEIDGNHQQIRPYPRPVGYDFEVPQKKVGDTIEVYHDYVREMVMRFMVKPKDLLLATDVPQMPYEFHQLIVYKALEDIYLKLGQQGLAATYEKKYMKEINNLAKRYVDKIDQRVVRGRFHMAYGRPTYNGTTLRRLS